MRLFNKTILILPLILASCNPFLPTGGVSTQCTASVRLQWDQPLDKNNNPDTSVLGYNVYDGLATRNYSNIKNAGLPTPTNQPLYSLTGLQVGRTYYFAVTAYNSYGESGYSNEVTATLTTCGQLLNIFLSGFQHPEKFKNEETNP